MLHIPARKYDGATFCQTVGRGWHGAFHPLDINKMSEPSAKRRDTLQGQAENGEEIDDVHIGGKYIVQRSDGEWRKNVHVVTRGHVMSFFAFIRYS